MTIYKTKGVEVFKLQMEDKRITSRPHRFAVKPPESLAEPCNPLKPGKWYAHVYQTKIETSPNVLTSIPSRAMARELRRICGASYLPRQFDLYENSNIEPQPNTNQHRPATNNQNNQWFNSNTFQTLPAYPPGFQPSSNQNHLNFPNQVPISTNWQPYIQFKQRYLSTGFSNGKHNDYFNPALYRQMGNNI